MIKENSYKLNFISTRTLKNAEEESKLIYIANREFYKLFKKSNNAIYSNIVSAIMDHKTDMFNVKSVLLHNELIGIVNFYASKEIKLRQTFGFSHFKSNSPITNKEIHHFASEVPIIDEESMYLSRIAIVEQKQGKGYAVKLLEYFENESKKNGYILLSLHVHKNNTKAINLYIKFGFHIANDKKQYLKLLKSI